MASLGGFTQDRLDVIWRSLSTDQPVPGAKKMTDDGVEQSMSIVTVHGEVLVSRKPGGSWSDMPSVGDRGFS